MLSPEWNCGTTVLLGGTFLTVLQLSAVFSSPSPRRWLAAPSSGRERRMLCKCLRAGTTPGDGSQEASELYCLWFEGWQWQTSPQTNWIRGPILFQQVSSITSLIYTNRQAVPWAILAPAPSRAVLIAKVEQAWLADEAGQRYGANHSLLVCLWLLHVPLQHCRPSAEVSTSA